MVRNAAGILIAGHPTRDIVQLKINGQINKKLNYLLIDMNGKVQMKATISNPVTPINLSNLSQGTYILRVVEGKKAIQSFEIIKSP